MRLKGEEPTDGLNPHKSNKVNNYQLRRHSLNKLGTDSGYSTSQLRGVLSTMRERISRRRMIAAAIPLVLALVSWFAIPSFAAAPATVQFSEIITDLNSGQSSVGSLVASPGDRLQVTLDLQNISAAAVPNAVLVHELAALPVTGVQISGSSYVTSYANGSIGWEIGNLAPGAKAQLTFVATASSSASACDGAVGVANVSSANSATAVPASILSPLCIQIRVATVVTTPKATPAVPATVAPTATPSSSASPTPCVAATLSISAVTDDQVSVGVCPQVSPSPTATPSPSLLPPPSAAASPIPPAGAVQALTTLAADTSFGATSTPSTGAGVILLRNSVVGICLLLSGFILITGLRRNPHEVYTKV